MPGRLRHVVYIVLDTARADAFEPYGAATGTTPALAQLANKGWAAPYAVSPSSWTLPSHVGMLLGMPHRRAGLVKARQTQPRLCRPVLEANADRYLPRVLQAAGYRTTAVSTNLWIQPTAGFDIGFDAFHSFWNNRSTALAGDGFSARLRWAREGWLSRTDHGLTDVARVAQDWVDSLRTCPAPQLLFLNLTECHSPYLPPRPYNDLAARSRVRAGLEARQYLGLEAIWQMNLGAPLPPPAALGRMRHLYQRSITYMDDWLACFLEALDATGLLDDTVIIVTSDHGENLGEGGRLGHSFSLDERLVHVPLITSGFDQARPDEPLSLSSLPAALAAELDLVDAPWPDAREYAPVSQVEGVGEPDDPRVIDALERWGLGDGASFAMTSDAVAASTGRLKVIQRGHVEQFFDLTADPLELAPLTKDLLRQQDGDTVRLLRRQVAQALRSTDQALPAPELPGLPEPAPDGELAKQMRLLGYL